jgi:hypothetical protein
MHGGKITEIYKEKSGMIDDVYDELRSIGIVNSSSDFSTVWLGKQESYYRGLRSKQRQPSIHVLVSCACRLQGTGDSLLAYGDDQHKASGRKLKRLARRCFDEITSGHILSQYSSALPAALGS